MSCEIIIKTGNIIVHIIVILNINFNVFYIKLLVISSPHPACVNGLAVDNIKANNDI
jgi:hypothetical protein